MNTKGIEDGMTVTMSMQKQPVGGWKAVPESPTFSYQLAMYLTRNRADAPHMQAEINMFLYENGWKTMRGGSK